MLRPEDVLPNERYALVRDRRRAEIIALKRARRFALGQNATITFECRATVLFQIQEVMWIEGRAGAEALAREIDTYACLVPPPGALRASLMIHGGSAAFSAVVLVAGAHAVVAEEIAPGDPTDPVRYIGFAIDDALAADLLRGQPAHLRMDWPGACAVTSLPPALTRTLVSRPIHPASENCHVRSGGP